MLLPLTAGSNTNGWLVLIDRDSCCGNTKPVHALTHQPVGGGRNQILEQINDFTFQLAHSAGEEMTLTGLLLPFFFVYVCVSLCMCVRLLSLIFL